MHEINPVDVDVVDGTSFGIMTSDVDLLLDRTSLELLPGLGLRIR